MFSNLRRQLFALVALVCGFHLGMSTAVGGTLTGPITGGNRGWAFGSPSAAIDLTQYGYVEAEFFIEGSAASYAKNGTWNRDGIWSAAPAASAPFKTRLLVLRPASPAAFNGTVVVEWLNVTSGWDNAEAFAHANQAVLRGGYAWVGVSAQAVGVQLSPFSLKAWDPVRYGSLVHPGDAFAYDIVTQAAQALRQPAGANPLPGLTVARVIATGHSQAANGLATYVNAVQPLTNVFDGFLLHGRTVTALPLFPGAGGTVPAGSVIRTDTAVPVVSLQDEWTIAVAAAWLNRQADSAKFRLWEASGTGHIDRDNVMFTARIVQRDLGFPPPVCAAPMNEAPLRYLVDTAVVKLNAWVGGGHPPPHATSVIEMAAGAIVRDAHGNAKGGIRLPQLEVPTATYAGVGNAGPPPCDVSGITTAFDAQTLSSLYPNHGSYRSQFVHAVDDLRRAGFLLDFDAEDAKAK